MNGLSVSIQFGKDDRTNTNLKNETDVLYQWKEILKKRYNVNFIIVNNSSEYTTLQLEGALDLIRLKYGNVKWIKIFIPNSLKKKLIDDPRFADEKKKTTFYWKSILNDDDISVYFDILDESVKFMIENKL